MTWTETVTAQRLLKCFAMSFRHHFKRLFYPHITAGKLDLVVTTMNGRIIVLGSDTVYHPLRSWTSELQGRNGILPAIFHHFITVFRLLLNA